MFTGLVEGLGAVERAIPEGAGKRLSIAPPPELLTGVAIGDSVALNGCCLTVIEISAGQWSFEAGPETLAKTNLGRLERGARVNLERSLLASARIGGHFVLGHIDGTATIERRETSGAWVTVWFAGPEALLRLMVPKGSVAIDGVSLTLVDVERTRFSVALIPHTLEVTTLGDRQPGDIVNIETDILGKYIAKFVNRD